MSQLCFKFVKGGFTDTRRDVPDYTCDGAAYRIICLLGLNYALYVSMTRLGRGHHPRSTDRCHPFCGLYVWAPRWVTIHFCPSDGGKQGFVFRRKCVLIRVLIPFGMCAQRKRSWKT